MGREDGSSASLPFSYGTFLLLVIYPSAQDTLRLAKMHARAIGKEERFNALWRSMDPSTPDNPLAFKVEVHHAGEHSFLYVVKRHLGNGEYAAWAAGEIRYNPNDEDWSIKT